MDEDVSDDDEVELDSEYDRLACHCQSRDYTSYVNDVFLFPPFVLVLPMPLLTCPLLSAARPRLAAAASLCTLQYTSRRAFFYIAPPPATGIV